MRRIELLPGNPVPMFAGTLIVVGMLLCLGSVLCFMVLGMKTTGEDQGSITEGVLLGLGSIFLISLGVWKMVDMGRKMKDEEEE